MGIPLLNAEELRQLSIKRISALRAFYSSFQHCSHVPVLSCALTAAATTNFSILLCHTLCVYPRKTVSRYPRLISTLINYSHCVRIVYASRFSSEACLTLVDLPPLSNTSTTIFYHSEAHEAPLPIPMATWVEFIAFLTKNQQPRFPSADSARARYSSPNHKA